MSHDCEKSYVTLLCYNERNIALWLSQVFNYTNKKLFFSRETIRRSNSVALKVS